MDGGGLDILLVRHGRTEWNEQGRLMGRNDVPLSAAGRADVEALAAALRDVALDRVVASPQARAQETARAIVAGRGFEVATEPDLAEVWVDAAWQGKTWAELSEDIDLKRYMADSTHRFAMIEAAETIRDRVVAVIERLRVEAGGRRIALVSHGDPIRVLTSHLLEMPLTDYRRLTIETASLTVFRLRGRPHLHLLNWRPGSAASLLDHI